MYFCLIAIGLLIIAAFPSFQVPVIGEKPLDNIIQVGQHSRDIPCGAGRYTEINQVGTYVIHFL